jgi:hypothetical protein
MLGVAAIAVLAGILIAVLSFGGDRHRRVDRVHTNANGRSDVQLAADYLGTSARELRRRLRAGETLSGVASTTPGHSTAGLIAALMSPRETADRRTKLSPAREHALIALQRKRVVAEVRRGRRKNGLLATSARYLGVSEARLRAELRSGRTFAQVADATPKRSTKGLLHTIVAARTSRLDLARRHGAITAHEERTALASLRARVERQLHRGLQ